MSQMWNVAKLTFTLQHALYNDAVLVTSDINLWHDTSCSNIPHLTPTTDTLSCLQYVAVYVGQREGDRWAADFCKGYILKAHFKAHFKLKL